MRLFVRYSQSRRTSSIPATSPAWPATMATARYTRPIKNDCGRRHLDHQPGFGARSPLRLFRRCRRARSRSWPAAQRCETLFGIPGLPTDPQYTGGVTYQYFIDGGFTSLGRLWTSPQYQNPTMWDPKANYTRLMGSHSLKAGVEYQMLHVAQQDLHPVMGGNVYTEPAIWSRLRLLRQALQDP